MLTSAARFSVNQKAAVRNKIETCNKESLVLKLEKLNNLLIFCRTTVFQEVKRTIENTVSKINKVGHIRNEDQEGRIYRKSLRVREKE